MQPLLIKGNESYSNYGVGGNGVEIWTLFARPTEPGQLNPEGRFKGGLPTLYDTKTWHNLRGGVTAGQGQANTFRLDGYINRQAASGAPGARSPCLGTAISSSAAYAIYIEVDHADLSGAERGIETARQGIKVENSHLQNCHNMIQDSSLAIPYLVRNVTFGTVAHSELHAIEYTNDRINHEDEARKTFPFDAAWMPSVARYLVYDYQGIPGNNYELFLRQQLPDYKMLYRGEPNVWTGCPEPLTVQQCFAKYGLAPQGQVASCTTTLPEITAGAACKFSGDAAPAQYNQQPRVLITFPLPDAQVPPNSTFYGAITGDPSRLKTAATYWIQSDRDKPAETSGYIGTRFIQQRLRTEVGQHTVSVFLADKNGVEIPGSRDTLTYTVVAAR
jgi:hypothetical protein